MCKTCTVPGNCLAWRQKVCQDLILLITIFVISVPDTFFLPVTAFADASILGVIVSRGRRFVAEGIAGGMLCHAGEAVQTVVFIGGATLPSAIVAVAEATVAFAWRASDGGGGSSRRGVDLARTRAQPDGQGGEQATHEAPARELVWVHVRDFRRTTVPDNMDFQPL
jgi:hypothetical protein